MSDPIPYFSLSLFVLKVVMFALVEIQHPNIVQLYEIFDTPKCVFMVMELLTGGELFEKIAECGSFSEREAAKVVKDVTEGILYLHKQGIVHRDLKVNLALPHKTFFAECCEPENILYRSTSPKSDIVITDFGLAKYLKNPTTQAMTSVCGTPLYAGKLLRSFSFCFDLPGKVFLGRRLNVHIEPQKY